jgi:transcriptional regulator with XRE-family HTH domain
MLKWGMPQKAPNNIKKIRDSKDMSQGQLGDLVGTTSQQIGRLEKGERRLTQGWMERLGRALGVSPALLIDDANTTQKRGVENDDVIWSIMDVIIDKARKSPDIDNQKLIGIAMAVYRIASAGKLPPSKGKAGKKFIQPIETEVIRLIEYERGKLN